MGRGQRIGGVAKTSGAGRGQRSADSGLGESWPFPLISVGLGANGWLGSTLMHCLWGHVLAMLHMECIACYSPYICV